MLLLFCLCRSRHIFFRGIHSAINTSRPSAEDIIFKALCVNIRQRKWKFLFQVSHALTSSLLSRSFLEFQSSPQLLFDFYKKVREHKPLLDSLESCCVLISVLVEQRSYGNALSLIKELILSKGYLSLQILKALMRTSFCGFFPSNAVFDVLITACTEMGATESAYDVIKKLREEKLQIPLHAMNNFLSHLLRIREVARFWTVYKEMVSNQYHENRTTYNLVMYALCKECRLAEAFSVLYNMVKMGIMPDVLGFNMLIDGAFRGNDFILASKIFREMGTISMGFVSPNIVTYNCLINGYCKRSKPEVAEKILNQLLDETDLKPNVRTYATLLDGYSRNGDLVKAFGLYDEMIKQGMVPNSAVYNSFIHALYMEGDISGVSIILSDMMEKNISPDKFTVTIILKGLCMNRLMNEAMKLQIWIEEKNITVDAFFYNILTDYLCRNGNISGANQVLCNMISRGLIPDQVTYSSIIKSCCIAGEMGKAVQVYMNMVKSNTQPNLVIYNSILNGMGSISVCEFFLEEMKRENIYDAVSYNTLLNSYCRNGKFEEAFELFRSMGMKSVASYNIMINLLCRFGIFEGVKEIVVMMRFHGLVPDSITYTTVLMNMRKKGCGSEEVMKMHDFLILEGVKGDYYGCF